MRPAKPTDSKKAALVNAVMKNLEKHRWMKFRSALHLHSEEAADRLTSILALHLLLDSAVEAILTVRLLGSGKLKGNFGKVSEAVRRVTFTNRIEIAKAAGLISDSCMADIKAVNKVRNALAHTPSRNRVGSVHVEPEISSSKDFDRCMVRGERALDEIMTNINLLLGIESPRDRPE
ncbi:MAG: hypothetical protein OEU68_07265 [Nitrospira sp.]|nr:hypothetical protein [Nitrospira sp.]MDH4245045.1 hypothetical protein [Nitrospira sp.]MDH4355950.1 hypothetical protein [Nitrospira sp.]MDH5319377.1 hypothetical protein [Nitrospira sp.]